MVALAVEEGKEICEQFGIVCACCQKTIRLCIFTFTEEYVAAMIGVGLAFTSGVWLLHITDMMNGRPE